jgi:hypothetical protein
MARSVTRTMARCPPGLLDDLDDVLAAVRAWAGVIEKSPSVFYAHRRPFLHFHLEAGGRRRADIRSLAGWIALDLPRPISRTRRAVFLRELRRRYAERGGSKSSGRSGRKSMSKASQRSFEHG